MASMDDAEGDSWGRPGEGRMEESRLDHGIDYRTLRETAHINVAIDKLMAHLNESMDDLQKNVQEEASTCMTDMSDFQKRFDVILNIYLGEGTEIRVKRHVSKIKEDIEAYNAKCCQSINKQAENCAQMCAKVLREMFDNIKATVDSTLDEHEHRVRMELLWIRSKYEEKLEAVRLSKARELREKEIADQAYLRERRDQFHRRSQAIILECLTKFRTELGHLRKENSSLESQLLVNRLSLKISEDKVSELKTQLTAYENPDPSEAGGPRPSSAGDHTPGRANGGSVIGDASILGAGGDRLIKQLKGEVFRLKQKEDIAALREKEGHRHVASLSDKLERLQATHDALQHTHNELTKAHATLQKAGRRKSTGAGGKRRASHVSLDVVDPDGVTSMHTVLDPIPTFPTPTPHMMSGNNPNGLSSNTSNGYFLAHGLSTNGVEGDSFLFVPTPLAPGLQPSVSDSFHIHAPPPSSPPHKAFASSSSSKSSKRHSPNTSAKERPATSQGPQRQQRPLLGYGRQTPTPTEGIAESVGEERGRSPSRDRDRDRDRERGVLSSGSPSSRPTARQGRDSNGQDAAAVPQASRLSSGEPPAAQAPKPLGPFGRLGAINKHNGPHAAHSLPITLRPPAGDPSSSPPRSPAPPPLGGPPYRSPFTLAYYNHAQDEDMTALRHARARRNSRASSADNHADAATDHHHHHGSGGHSANSRPTTPVALSGLSGAADNTQKEMEMEMLRQTSATSLAVMVSTVKVNNSNGSGDEAGAGQHTKTLTTRPDQHTVDMYREGAGWVHTGRPQKTGGAPTSPTLRSPGGTPLPQSASPKATTQPLTISPPPSTLPTAGSLAEQERLHSGHAHPTAGGGRPNARSPQGQGVSPPQRRPPPPHHHQPPETVANKLCELPGLLPQDLMRFLAEERQRHNERMGVLHLQLQEKDLLLSNSVRMVQDYRHEYDDVARRLLKTALDLKDRLQAHEAALYHPGGDTKLTPLTLPINGKSILVKAPFLGPSTDQSPSSGLTLHFPHSGRLPQGRQNNGTAGRPSTCPDMHSVSASSTSSVASDYQRAVRTHLRGQLFARHARPSTINSPAQESVNSGKPEPAAHPSGARTQPLLSSSIRQAKKSHYVLRPKSPDRPGVKAHKK